MRSGPGMIAAASTRKVNEGEVPLSWPVDDVTEKLTDTEAFRLPAMKVPATGSVCGPTVVTLTSANVGSGAFQVIRIRSFKAMLAK
ncbi:hypothetical protein D3C77_536460 [compost metagenome]